jgi:hypothetical protein
MAALFGGIKSDAWKSYMAVFADNPDQLTRLTEEVDGEEPYLKQMRAYVVTSAVCDPGTNLNIAGKVDFKIDGTNSPMNPDVRSDLDDDTIVNLRPNLLKTVRNTP